MTTPYNPYATQQQPVIVQGTVVSQTAPTYSAQTYNNSSSTNVAGVIGSSNVVQGTGEWDKGSVQPKRCNDVAFAILFYAHLGFIIYATAAYAPAMFDDMYEGYANRRRLSFGRWLQEEGNENEDLEINMNHLMIVLAIAGVVGFTVSSLALGLLMKFSEGMIKAALIFNIISNGLMCILFFLTGAIPMGVLFLMGFAFTCYYTYVVWGRIPFAAANLETAITAVRANFGLTFFAYSGLFATFGWSIWWSIAAVSTSYVTNGCNAQGECEKQGSGLVLFLFLLSYFWTVQVIQNVTHVTVAGTVGTWWFVPEEASSCCSSAVRDSWIRSVTSSFGSICFGSLIVALIQAARQMLHQMRESDDGICLCLAECLLACIESLAEYFCKWAYVYVGLYGYSFMEAGKNVMTLFHSRGWTAIIADMMVDMVLGMVSVGVGIISGLFAILIAAAMGLELGNASTSIGGPFLIGFLFGFVLAGCLFSVVSSAVNSIIVLFAEAPAEFQQNHPQLSDRMRETWTQAWPGEFRS